MRRLTHWGTFAVMSCTEAIMRRKVDTSLYGLRSFVDAGPQMDTEQSDNLSSDDTTTIIGVRALE